MEIYWPINNKFRYLSQQIALGDMHMCIIKRACLINEQLHHNETILWLNWKIVNFQHCSIINWSRNCNFPFMRTLDTSLIILSCWCRWFIVPFEREIAFCEREIDVWQVLNGSNLAKRIYMSLWIDNGGYDMRVEKLFCAKFSAN
jgi:hypothetical protein